MYESVIADLEALAREQPARHESLSTALGLVRFCANEQIEQWNRTTRLPEATTHFGHFRVNECDEDGNALRPVTDEQGEPLELLSHSVIVEQLNYPSEAGDNA